MTPLRSWYVSLGLATLTVLASLSSAAPLWAQQLAGNAMPRSVTDSEVRRTVDSLAKAFLEAGEAPGVSILVVHAADTLVSQGYGRADIENDVPATPRSVYRIGSITKQFTSSAVMQLVEAGRVRLDEPIATYLPALPARWRPVTVRQLLNHTSGIPSYTDIGPRWLRRLGEQMPPDTLIALTAADTLNFAPGSNWRYNNTGYVLLGLLIEKLSGKPYAAYLQERFFTPLGLTGTTYCDNDPIIPHRVHGYTKAGGEWRNAAFIDMSQPFSAGALCSTVEDLARWNRFLATGKVVSAASYQQMTTPSGAAAKQGYGFGLASQRFEGHPMIGHGGGIPGFSTDNAYFPVDTLSITVLPNSDRARPDRLLSNIARVVFGMPLEPAPKPASTR